MKAIGPTFYSELKSAGVSGLPFSWGEDGDICFNEAMTQGQIDAVNAVYAAHEPNAPPTAEQIKAAALSELTEMEREALMPRVTREFLIAATLMQAAQLGISQTSLLDPLDPAFSPGFKKMWDFNQKTIELRKKL